MLSNILYIFNLICSHLSASPAVPFPPASHWHGQLSPVSISLLVSGHQFQSVVVLVIHLTLYVPRRDSIPRTAVSLLIPHPVQLEGFEGKSVNKTTILECKSFKCQY